MIFLANPIYYLSSNLLNVHVCILATTLMHFFFKLDSYGFILLFILQCSRIEIIFYQDFCTALYCFLGFNVSVEKMLILELYDIIRWLE